MSLPRWQRTIVDGLGNVLPAATITVYNEVGGALSTLFSDRAGVTPLGNPFTADGNGFAFFYSAAGEYRIDVTSGAFSQTLRYDVVTFAYDPAVIAAGYQPLDAILTSWAVLADPNADRIGFWDDSAGNIAWLTIAAGSGILISGTNLSAQTVIATIASGSLPAAAVLDIINIPSGYKYLVLMLTGVSSNTATRHALVQLSVNNGLSFDATAANYAGTVAEATMISGVDVAAAVTLTAAVAIFGYQGGMYPVSVGAGIDSAGVRAGMARTYIGSLTAINALRILLNGSGTFDAGTYTLLGVL